MTRSVLVVEDEPVAADTLRGYLKDAEGFECAGVAGTGPEAVAALERLEPDLVLLDVELPGISGVEVLLRADHEPAVVFTTAYDRHAVTAFEFGAFDYLVKPFGRDRFRQALDRVRERLRTDAHAPSAASRAEATAAGREPLQRLFVRSGEEILPVRLDDAIRLEARGDYVEVHLEDASHLVSLPLAEFERRLDARRFLRVHRSHIVNLDRVVRLEDHDGRRLRLEMEDGSSVVASRSGSKALRDRAV